MYMRFILYENNLGNISIYLRRAFVCGGVSLPPGSDQMEPGFCRGGPSLPPSRRTADRQPLDAPPERTLDRNVEFGLAVQCNV
jgi:hypothetical protein